jgi:hypothetical protein
MPGVLMVEVIIFLTYPFYKPIFITSLKLTSVGLKSSVRICEKYLIILRCALIVYNILKIIYKDWFLYFFIV